MKRNYCQIANEYAQGVVNGTIPACRYIKRVCQRTLDDAFSADSRWHFDSARAIRLCQFVESLTLESTGGRFILQPWQCWLLCTLMGWVDDQGLRKYIEALILVPKGNGKSPIAAALGLWFAFFDGRRSAEVFTGAMSLKQAMEVFKPARSFVESQPSFKRLGVEAQKQSIYAVQTGSFFQPVVGRGRHGARPYLAILDELHQAVSPDLYDTFKTGCNKVVNSLLLTISTAGVVSQENPCYALVESAKKILDGTFENDRFLPVLYGIDDTVEWHTPEALRMSNPNLGISNDAEKIRLAQIEAVNKPEKQNVFKAMHLNVWSTAASSWMNMASWAKCYDPNMTEESVKHLDCWLGSDLASKLDLSATVKLYRDDSRGEKPHYYCFTRTYLPEERVNLPECQHYQAWVKQGWLTATDGSSMDYRLIERDTLADIATFRVQEISYDARYADEYAQRVSEESGIPRVVVQPSPAELSPALKELEAAVADGRFHHDSNPVLTYCISNVLVRESSVGNYTMPSKPTPEAKIDAAVALLIAMARARRAVPQQTAGIFFA